jgi:hypothetical protein
VSAASQPESVDLPLVRGVVFQDSLNFSASALCVITKVTPFACPNLWAIMQLFVYNVRQSRHVLLSVMLSQNKRGLSGGNYERAMF